MTGKVIASYSTSVNSSISNNTLVDSSEIINNHTVPTVYSPMQVATAVTLSVGIIQVMYLLTTPYRNKKNYSFCFLVGDVYFKIGHNKFFAE